MNAQQKYLAWLRLTAPTVYVSALRKVAGKPRGLGGLRDDLIGRMCQPSTGFGFLGDDGTDAIPTITVTADAPTDTIDTSSLALTPDDLSSLNTTLDQMNLQSSVSLPTIDNTGTVTTPAVSAGSGGLFASIVQAVGAVTAAGMQASSQSGLIRLNTQRAQQGLPPVNAQGVPISTGFFTPSSNPQLAAFESKIGGVVGSPVLWIAGLGIAAVLLLSRKRA